MAEELQGSGRSARAIPDLIDKIADERVATDVEGTVKFVTEKDHPALSMPPLM